MTWTFDALVERARALTDGGRRAVLGITGAPAAGKTTLAEQLVRTLGGWAVHVPMDGFHLADVELCRLGRLDRKGAPDTFDALGYAAMLHRLHQDADAVIYAPAFDRGIEQPIAGAIPVPPAARLIVSEGNYLLVEQEPWAQVSTYFDEIWYVELEQPERLRRLVERHVRFGKDRAAAITWASGTDERNAELIAATKARADLIITTGSAD